MQIVPVPHREAKKQVFLKVRNRMEKKRTERFCPDGLLRLDIQTRCRVKVNRQRGEEGGGLDSGEN